MMREKVRLALKIILIICIAGLGYIIPFNKVDASVEVKNYNSKFNISNIVTMLEKNVEDTTNTLFAKLESVNEVINGVSENIENLQLKSVNEIGTELYKLNISTIDFDSQDVIEGNELELYDIEGNKIHSWTSTKRPENILLKRGTYVVKETKIVDNYIGNADDFVFTINEDGSITNSSGKRIDTEFLFEQELADRNKFLKDTNNVDLVSDERLNKDTQEIKNSGSLSLSNKHISTTIKLTETDSLNNKKLDGAVFGIYDKSNGKLVYTSEETNENGVVVLYKVPLNKGEYYIQQITSPEGYKLSKNKKEFTVSGTDSFEIKFSNRMKLI